MMPIVIGGPDVRRSLAWDRLIPGLEAAFAGDAVAPTRNRYDIEQPDGTTASLVIMPSWQAPTSARRGYAGTKLVSVFPGNSTRSLRALSSSYLLMDGSTGHHLALLDGDEITGRRTAAASALAASFLARPEAATLLVVGAGHIASLIPHAMRTIRPIRRVIVWNRHAAGAERLAAALRTANLDASATTDLARAAGEADIISTATLSTEPLIVGDWLRPGTHVDLVGGFTPAMREADDAALGRASVFVDTEAALLEAGDILGPIGSGAMRAADIRGTLADLCRRTHPGRQSADAITLFKSVGTALEDLAAAILAYEDAINEEVRTDATH